MLRWLNLGVIALASGLPAAEVEGWLVDAPKTLGEAAVVRLWPGTLPAKPGLSASAGGQSLRCRLLWSAPGEPLLALVEANRSGPWRLAITDKPGDDPTWRPKSGVLLEVRSRPDGPIEKPEEVRALWERGQPQGMAVVDSIFQGFNPCGPSRDCQMRFTGWLRVDKAGEYRVATISQDASVLELDGRKVAQWCGWHGADGPGLRSVHGQNLQLSAGLHEVTYHLAAGGGIIAVMSWMPPGTDHPVQVPPAVFVQTPEAQAHPEKPGPWFTWEAAGHNDSEHGLLVEMRLKAQGTGKAECRWSFDDGLAESGAEASHLFVRPGLHRVRLSVGGATVERQVAVRQNWSWLGGWDDDALRARALQLAKRDPLAMASADFTATVRLAVELEGRSWLGALADAGGERLARQGEQGVDGDGRRALLLLGGSLQGLRPPDTARVDRLWDRIAALGKDADPEASLAALHRAGMLIHVLDRAGDGAAALAQARAAALPQTEQRLLLLYRGDAAAAKGDLEAARAAYAEARDAVDPADRLYAVRRRTRLEQARDRLAMGDLDAAAKTLGEIEWETPRERIGADTGLLQARLHLQRNDPVAAIARLRILLAAVPPDDRRADALLLLIKASLAANRADEAKTALATLRRDHPYSEAAAAAAAVKM